MIDYIEIFYLVSQQFNKATDDSINKFYENWSSLDTGKEKCNNLAGVGTIWNNLEIRFKESAVI